MMQIMVLDGDLMVFDDDSSIMTVGDGSTENRF